MKKIMKSKIKLTMENGPVAGTDKEVEPSNLKPHLSEERREQRRASLAASLLGKVL